MTPAARQVALSKVVAGLSYALDVTEGEPAGHAVRTCLIGMRLAEELRLDAATRSELFYALLLKDAGCSANAARMAALFHADDQAAKRSSKRVDWSGAVPAFVWAARTAAGGGPLRARIRVLRGIRDVGEVTRSLMQARCERGAAIALLLGLGQGTAEAIRSLDEHWDGRGQPRNLRGQEIPLLGRILCLAQTAEIFWGRAGAAGALAVARRRSGRWFDPQLVAALEDVEGDRPFWDSLAEGDVEPWEPQDRLLRADDERLDGIAEAFAGVIDAKSPWTYRHSDRTCVVAMSLAAALGADPWSLGELRRAALLHDIGKLSISNRILDKPAALTPFEFAAVREHPRVTEDILRRVPGFAALAPVAGAHHERLDGGGYPQGLTADALTLPMRVLAVADVYDALTSVRPYRPAIPSDRALAILRAEAPRSLDGGVVHALEDLLTGTRVPAELATPEPWPSPLQGS
jgi:HD-GYP domain-containing protein (c-di-GMP phosphodiesterase class II)